MCFKKNMKNYRTYIRIDLKLKFKFCVMWVRIVYSKAFIDTYRFRSRKYFLKVNDNFLESFTWAESTQAQEGVSTYMTASEKNITCIV